MPGYIDNLNQLSARLSSMGGMLGNPQAPWLNDYINQRAQNVWQNPWAGHQQVIDQGPYKPRQWNGSQARYWGDKPGGWGAPTTAPATPTYASDPYSMPSVQATPGDTGYTDMPWSQQTQGGNSYNQPPTWGDNAGAYGRPAPRAPISPMPTDWRPFQGNRVSSAGDARMASFSPAQNMGTMTAAQDVPMQQFGSGQDQMQLDMARKQLMQQMTGSPQAAPNQMFDSAPAQAYQFQMNQMAQAAPQSFGMRAPAQMYGTDYPDRTATFDRMG